MEADPITLVGQIFEASQQGHWLVVTGLALMLVVWVAKRFLAGWIPFLKTRPGGYVLAFSCALVPPLAAVLVGGAVPTLQMFLTSLSAALVASGGWEAVRDAFGKPDQA